MVVEMGDMQRVLGRKHLTGQRSKYFINTEHSTFLTQNFTKLKISFSFEFIRFVLSKGFEIIRKYDLSCLYIDRYQTKYIPMLIICIYLKIHLRSNDFVFNLLICLCTFVIII